MFITKIRDGKFCVHLVKLQIIFYVIGLCCIVSKKKIYAKMISEILTILRVIPKLILRISFQNSKF